MNRLSRVGFSFFKKIFSSYTHDHTASHILRCFLQSFKSVAKTLGSLLNERDDLRGRICQAIRLLVSRNLDNGTSMRTFIRLICIIDITYDEIFLPLYNSIWFETIDTISLDWFSFFEVNVIFSLLRINIRIFIFSQRSTSKNCQDMQRTICRYCSTFIQRVRRKTIQFPCLFWEL